METGKCREISRLRTGDEGKSIHVSYVDIGTDDGCPVDALTGF